jgi:anti-sigma factor ChrR (cupin superfamily)
MVQDRDESAILDTLGRLLSPVEPDPRVRREVLLLAEAPREPITTEAYAWREIAPGVRIHDFETAAAPGVTRHLVWAAPGAVHPRHRHDGDEIALVLQGRFRDDHASFGPGDICRRRQGSVHTAHFEGGEDCVCYVLCYEPA